MAPGSIAYDTESEAVVTGTITAVSQTVAFDGPNTGTEAVQITGTWVGTMVVEATVDNTNWSTISFLNATTGLFVTSLAANGMFLIPSNAYVSTRVRASAWTSGTATIINKGNDAASVVASDAKIRGATDGSFVGNIGDRMKVDASLTSGQLVPTITNKLRVRYNIADVTLPNTNAFQTIYSRSGTGLFFGMQLGFDNDHVSIRVTIDGGVMFTLPLGDIKDFEFNDVSDGRIQMGGFFTAVGNVFDFSTRYAIPQATSLLIEAASNDGSAHKLKRYMVIQTEDT